MIKYNRLLEILKIPRNSSREEIIAKLIEVRNDNTNIAVDMGFRLKLVKDILDWIMIQTLNS